MPLFLISFSVKINYLHYHCLRKCHITDPFFDPWCILSVVLNDSWSAASERRSRQVQETCPDWWVTVYLFNWCFFSRTGNPVHVICCSCAVVWWRDMVFLSWKFHASMLFVSDYSTYLHLIAPIVHSDFQLSVNMPQFIAFKSNLPVLFFLHIHRQLY